MDYLSNREEKNLAVVTHGFILRIVMAVVVHGEKLTGEECEAFIQTFHHENTGITVLGYDEDKSKWWLWAWNDHAHLSELKD